MDSKNKLSVENNPFANKMAFGADSFATPWGGSSNPFAQTAPVETIDDGEQGYAMVKNGPDVNPDEVELQSVPAVEVMILWEQTVLSVEHLTPPRAYWVGEEQSKNLACDYFLPSEKLGATRAPVVLVEGGAAYAVILPGATGTIETPAHGKIKVEQAIAIGLATPCAELAGAHKVELTTKTSVRVETNGLVFRVAAVAAGKRYAKPLFAAAAGAGLGMTALSFLVHAGLLAGFAFFRPALNDTDDANARQERTYLMSQLLKDAIADEEQPKEKTDDQADAKDDAGGSGKQAMGESGAMGNQMSRDANKRWAKEGPKENTNPMLDRQRAIQDAQTFGLAGILASNALGDPKAPTAPWGMDNAQGADEKSANGAMFAADIGDAYGIGGLGLTGIGDGGGGLYAGIGMGTIGTIGHGGKDGIDQGFGRDHGRVQGDHVKKDISVRPAGQTQVSGHIPADVIQRIVRQNFGRFRMCYENGLRGNPSLSGRVAVRFVIGRDGAVANVSNGGSDLPDSAVVSCVVRSFGGMSFPQPEGGIVTVVYPIVFSPGS